MYLSRRAMLKAAAAAGMALPIAGLAACSDDAGSTGKLLRSGAPLPEPFRRPLTVPPVLKPSRGAGEDRYEITARAADVEILPGLTTRIWGYDGLFPGPTIEARSGRRVVVRTRNELPVPIVTHLHGGVTPPESDGYPTDLVLPVSGGHAGHDGAHGGRISRGEKEYVYPLEQRAGTLWTHDHRMDFTGPQVYRGLAAFFIVRDDEDDALPLPRGDKDIPLMITDRSFAEDGSLLYPSLDPDLARTRGTEPDYMDGVLGDVILVNGTPWPSHEVTNTRHRLRLLNASNARRYELTLDPPPESGGFQVIGSDLGLLDAPRTLSTLPIAQAERFDVVVDFSGYPIGTEVTLRNKLGEGRLGQVMRFVVAAKERETASVPQRLSRLDFPDPEQISGTRTFSFYRESVHDHLEWTVNGKPFDMKRVDARPRLGTTERWLITSDVHHPFHLHLAHFKVLSRNDKSPRDTDAGWKDTVDLRPGEHVQLLVRFSGYRGRYVLHCHNLEHEDMAMMVNFDVV